MLWRVENVLLMSCTQLGNGAGSILPSCFRLGENLQIVGRIRVLHHQIIAVFCSGRRPPAPFTLVLPVNTSFRLAVRAAL